MDMSIARRRMVEKQLIGRGITDAKVIEVMSRIPRHLFIPEALRDQAYGDYPVPIGEKQTISQAFTVAFMTQSLELDGDEKILEVGTGSGYQAAVLSQLADKVYTVERIASLARQARRVLDQLACRNVNLKVSDGTLGWENEAPFDGILVTAGAPAIPDEYRCQLSIGGRLIIPVGGREQQDMIRVTRLSESDYREEKLLDCRFVPLIGSQGWDGR